VIRRILCPVDFSPFSERALRYGAALAAWYDAELTLLWVRPKHVPGAPHRSDADAGGQTLEEFVSAVIGDGKTRLLTAEGSVVNEILRTAAGTAADLIVMGTHGASGFGRLLLGSVAETVLRRARCPVLTVPRLMAAAPADRVSLNTILCAVDFSPSSRHALNYALSFAQKARGRLLLLHALEWFAEEEEGGAADGAPGFPSSEEDARAQLDELVPDEARAWCDPEMIVGYGEPAHEVLRVASEQHADLIVLGVQGRAAIDLTLFGSTAQRAVREATCPVLTVGQAT
jgi:nucleotide-binding universal stress UspA family protein